MAAPMQNSSESSSSEDEETSAKLREAVFDFGIRKNDKTLADSNQKIEKERIHVLEPSKRPDKEIPEQDQFDNAYNTTPGFKKHVSKKLSEALDSYFKKLPCLTCESVIDSSSQYFCKSEDNTEESSGVKLFSSSKSALQIDSSKRDSSKPVNKRPRLPSSGDSSSEDERLAEASVSHDFILKQSNLPYLTNQKAADIVINQAGPPSVTLNNTNQADSLKSEFKTKHNGDTKEETIGNKEVVDNKVEEVCDILTKKHKKKKKKKHKKGVD